MPRFDGRKTITAIRSNPDYRDLEAVRRQRHAAGRNEHQPRPRRRGPLVHKTPQSQKPSSTPSATSSTSTASWRNDRKTVADSERPAARPRVGQAAPDSNSELATVSEAGRRPAAISLIRDHLPADPELVPSRPAAATTSVTRFPLYSFRPPGFTLLAENGDPVLAVVRDAYFVEFIVLPATVHLELAATLPRVTHGGPGPAVNGLFGCFMTLGEIVRRAAVESEPLALIPNPTALVVVRVVRCAVPRDFHRASGPS